MAASHWYTGRNSATTATVIVRSASTEMITVAIPGQSINVFCDTSVNDGNATAEFTGLTAGQTYAYTVGGVAGGTLRTKPAGYPFWIALTSCWQMQSLDGLALRLLDTTFAGATAPLMAECTQNLAAFFSLGDWVYKNVNATVRGVTLLPIDSPAGSIANAKSLSANRDYYRCAFTMPGVVDLIRSVPTYFMKDDHEHDPDNGCNSLTWLQGHYPAATQQDFDDVWATALTTWSEWNTGNPAAEVSGCMAYSVTLGNLQLFVTDLISERDYHGDTDSATKRMMSSAQEEWLLNGLNNSSATFTAWLSSKQFISSCGRNGDGWTELGGASKGYETQLGRVLADARFPRTGCLSVTGDEHIPSDMYVPADHYAAGSAAISQISAGPATIEVITDAEDGLSYRTGVRAKERDVSGLSRRGENNYVLLRVLADRVERYRLSSRYGLRYMGYVSTADNVVRR